MSARKPAAAAKQAAPPRKSPGARHVAFLRAINVGGRTVTMDRLRAAFDGLPVADVATFIASGNVIFSTGTRDLAALEAKIERQLEDVLGYEVLTFVRSAAEIAALAAFAPFDGVADGHKVHVGFLRAAPSREAVARLTALGTDYDTLAVHGRELWWWTKGNMSDSPIPNGAFEKALGVPTTMRNVTTVRRLAERLGDA